ncbi:long-chain fatty acid--CoA ligase [Fibrobacter sp. UWB11]|uniref:AMP-dependent synthetase/ligase n=1 Tax=Fibrobacter sp. UWB11 TaxID=1896202 RepID=UPI00092C00D5|nr:long-chain fatty acid--CoA ligase [Fibrobacter sp. UWB11]SIN90843.1 long-chain acyl-CoA synthetase [Fibrobacter sp. UWB11]
MEELQFTSLPSMFFANCDRSDFKGWYHRKNGEWIHYSPQKLKTETKALALALNSLGLTKNESVGIIAPSSPNWLIADIAIQLNQACVVPLFPNISSENFLFQINDANVRILIVNSIEELDAPLLENLSFFKTIICMENSSSRPPNGIYWNELIKRGSDALADKMRAKWIDNQLATINPDDQFSIIYTSGSTGRPKGAELTHRNMLVQIQNIAPMFRFDTQKDSCLTILPVAHVLERMAVYFYTLSGVSIYFGDNPKNLSHMLREVRPTIMIVVPRILERLYEAMTTAADRAKGLKRFAIKQAIKIAKIKDPTKRPCIMQRILNLLVYKQMREAVGGNFRMIISGSSSLNKSILRFLLNIGLPVFEGYGMTECSPVVSANCKQAIKPGSIGKPLPHLEVRIGECSEIQIRGESVFKGYHNRPDLNEKAFTEDGFYHSGDQGYFDDDGYLYFTGRIKELLKTSTGKYVSPNPIELEIIRHPLVEQALVIANDRKFVSAIIWLNPVGARRMLKPQNEDYDVENALRSPLVRDAINRHIEHINEKLNHWEQIRKWTLIGDELTIESGLLTPTLKIRRTVAEKRYAEQIEKMYS